MSKKSIEVQAVQLHVCYQQSGSVTWYYDYLIFSTVLFFLITPHHFTFSNIWVEIFEVLLLLWLTSFGLLQLEFSSLSTRLD